MKQKIIAAIQKLLEQLDFGFLHFYDNSQMLANTDKRKEYCEFAARCE